MQFYFTCMCISLFTVCMLTFASTKPKPRLKGMSCTYLVEINSIVTWSDINNDLELCFFL